MPEEIKSAEKTDNSVLEETAGKELNEDAVIADDSKAKDGSEKDNTEFTDTEKETVKTDGKQPEVEKKPSQTKEDNRKFKEERLKSEAEKKALELDFVKQYVGKNPYTDEKIETVADMETYKIMKSLSEEGKDPIKDFYKYSKREAQTKEDETKKREEFFRKDAEDFKTKYPDVDIASLSGEKTFDKFRSLIGKAPMADIYEAYKSIKDFNTTKAVNTAKEELAKEIAKGKSSTGSLSGGENAGTIYSLEQLGKMSPAQIAADYDNVVKSYAALNKKT